MEANTQSWRARKRAEIAERRAIVAAKYKSGKTQVQIARELGCSQFLVSEDMASLVDGWKKQAANDIASHIAVELEKINRREEIAMEAYERSRKPKKIAKASTKNDPISDKLSIKSTTSSATIIERDEGDPRFLMVAHQCTVARMKLLRLGTQSVEEKTKGPTTFAEFVAAHLKGKTQNGNGTTQKVKGLPRPQLDPKRLP